jgi:hypothetical protein
MQTPRQQVASFRMIIRIDESSMEYAGNLRGYAESETMEQARRAGLRASLDDPIGSGCPSLTN